MKSSNRIGGKLGRQQRLTSGLAISILVGEVGCTGQIPGSFRFLQEEQVFKTSQDVNTKIDLLWVVDNSSSMDVHQKKLRDGFQGFAAKYLKPTWDIRVAVITTDTYLAHSDFTTYLQTTIPGSVNYISSYLSTLTWLNSFVNPTWDTTLVDTSTGSFPHGLTYGNLNPLWGSSYAKLQAGNHDGPVTAFCFEVMPYFLKGVTQCDIRDKPTANRGVEHCINPDTNAGESSFSECVNTIQNDTVRSGKPIISTVPPKNVAGDATWTQQLVRNFIVNASVGSSGAGSERGFGSLLQLIADNETSNNPFFRAGSTRGIIFLTDEDDQTFIPPSPLPSGYSPNWGYACDQASLLANNGNSPLIDGNNGLCCSDPSKHCKYGSLGTSCPSKTVDGFTYNLGVCADPTKLLPVETVKQQLDQFFRTLDSAPVTQDPNYFVAAITPTTGASVQSIVNARSAIDAAAGTIRVLEADRGDRYIELGQLVNGSMSLDLGESDYSPVLDAIGQEIVQKKSTFTLARAPTNKEEMTVTIIHANGTNTSVPSSDYTISGKILTMTNQDFVLSLSYTDRVSINYQPKTAF